MKLLYFYIHDDILIVVYLAVRIHRQIAYDEGHHFPIAKDITLQEFYMEDLMTAC